MKKILFLILVTAVFITNCKKQEPEAPISDTAAFNKFANAFSIADDSMPDSNSYQLVAGKIQMQQSNAENTVTGTAIVNYNGDPTIGSGATINSVDVSFTLNNYKGPEQIILNGSLTEKIYLNSGVYIKYNSSTNDYSTSVSTTNMESFTSSALITSDVTMKYKSFDYRIVMSLTSYYSNGKVTSTTGSVYINGRKLY